MRFLACLGGLGLSFLLAHPATGQELTTNVPKSSVSLAPATQTLYFDAHGRPVAQADSAEHREELIYRDSVGGTLRIYYPSGKLRRLVAYQHFRRGIQAGPESSYYETGELKSRCEYTQAGPVGPYVQFYRSGQVRMRTSLTGGWLGKGTGQAFGPDGKPVGFDATRDKRPSLGPGGNAAIVAAVQRGVHYPPEALRAHATGRVFVGFMVDDAGFVRHVQILKSASPLLNATVLQAVYALGRLAPGEMAGEPIDTFFTCPVTFAIR
jgi:protein TonB